MDPRYRPAELTLENKTFVPTYDNGGPGHSRQTSRASTFVREQWAVYPNQRFSSQGPTDANGYPIDYKGKLRNTLAEQRDAARYSEQTTPRDSIDLEKQKLKDADKHAEKHDAVPHDPHAKDPNQPPLPFFSHRLKHFTWAWYTLTMATGGIATLLSVQPHSFPGLISIGAFFYVLNLVFFTSICSLMVLRFTKFPGTFKESITHEREGLFLGPFFLSVATIITGTQKYVVATYEINHPMRSWIITTMSAAFWIYTFATFFLAVFQYSFLFNSHTYMLTKFMPSWLLPIFPVMLAGTVASVIAADQPVESRMPILVAGLGCQGLGFTVAILMYAHYIGRLMQVGLPNREHRPAMFISVGPPSFTCLALIGMSNALPADFDLQRDGLLDGNLLRTMALVVALFLWVLAMWFFMVSLIAVIISPPKYFHLGLWASVFPNSGFAIATIQIGNTLRDETVQFAGNGLTIVLVLAWMGVVFLNFRAVYVADIMYPGRDEDVED